MSWMMINRMLGLAAVDQVFCQQLLAHPLDAADAWGFDLTPVEREILSGIVARDIHEFSQMVLAKLHASESMLRDEMS